MNLYLIKIGSLGLAVIEAETPERAVSLFLEKTSGVKHIKNEEITLEKGNISQIEMTGKEHIIATTF